MTARELARRIGCSERTVFAQLRRGLFAGAVLRPRHGGARFLRFDEAKAKALWAAELERRKAALEWGKIPVGTP